MGAGPRTVRGSATLTSLFSKNELPTSPWARSRVRGGPLFQKTDHRVHLLDEVIPLLLLVLSSPSSFSFSFSVCVPFDFRGGDEDGGCGVIIVFFFGRGVIIVFFFSSSFTDNPADQGLPRDTITLKRYVLFYY